MGPPALIPRDHFQNVPAWKCSGTEPQGADNPPMPSPGQYGSPTAPQVMVCRSRGIAWPLPTPAVLSQPPSLSPLPGLKLLKRLQPALGDLILLLFGSLPPWGPSQIPPKSQHQHPGTATTVGLGARVPIATGTGMLEKNWRRLGFSRRRQR